MNWLFVYISPLWLFFGMFSLVIQVTRVHDQLLQFCPTLCNAIIVACQAPLSMGFSRQEYWSGWPRPPPGALPHPGIKPESLILPALALRFFTTSTTWEGVIYVIGRINSAFVSVPASQFFLHPATCMG